MSYSEKPQTVNPSGDIPRWCISHIFSSPILEQARDGYRVPLSRREAMLWILITAKPSIVLSTTDAAAAWGWSTKAARIFIETLVRAGVLERDPLRCGASKSVFTVHPGKLSPDRFVAKAPKPPKARPRTPIPPQTRDTVFERHEGRCAYCGTGLTRTPRLPNSFHVDHKKPVAAGGDNDPENLVASCLRCNLKKNAADFSKEAA